MMLGSLYSIVMGPTNLDTPKAAMSLDTFNVVFFIIGGAVIFGLQMLKHVFAKKEEVSE
jgi:putative membrane protein